MGNKTVPSAKKKKKKIKPQTRENRATYLVNWKRIKRDDEDFEKTKISKQLLPI